MVETTTDETAKANKRYVFTGFNGVLEKFTDGKPAFFVACPLSEDIAASLNGMVDEYEVAVAELRRQLEGQVARTIELEAMATQWKDAYFRLRKGHEPAIGLPSLLTAADRIVDIHEAAKRLAESAAEFASLMDAAGKSVMNGGAK